MKGLMLLFTGKQFLPSLKALDDCMVRWELVQTDESEEIHIVYPPNLPTGARPIVVIGHDESTFNTDDGRSKVWVKDKGVPLRKKTRGKEIMVSDFLTPGGRLQIPNEANNLLVSEYGMTDEGPNHLDPSLAACSIEYAGDTWWDGDQLVDQVLKLAISIFESAFPGCQALFLFDNATSHSAYSDNALQACMMNLRPGRGQALLRPGVTGFWHWTSVQGTQRQEGPKR